MNNIYKNISSFFSSRKANVFDIYIKNEKSGYTVLDKALFKFFGAKVVKEVKFEKEKDPFIYPASFNLAGKSFTSSIVKEKQASLIIDFKLNDKPLNNRQAIAICIPGDESEDINYIDTLSPNKLYRKYNLIIATNTNKFFRLNQIFKNKVKVIQCSNIASPDSAGHKRFIKICNIAANDPCNVFNLFYRMSVSPKDRNRYSIYQNLYGFLGYCRRGLFKQKLLSTYSDIIYPVIVDIWKHFCSSCLPIKNDCAVFRTFQQDYCCNPKYICNEFIKRKKIKNLIWVVSKEQLSSQNFPPEVTLVRQNSLKAWYYLTCSKYFFDNNVRKAIPYKKKGQIQVQTWHGSLGIKKFTSVWSDKTCNSANKDTDLLISNSQFETKVYRESVWKSTKILEIGHPRNDILLNNASLEAAKIKIAKFFNLKEESKIILYGPTFRDQHLYGSAKQKKDLSMYLCYEDLCKVKLACEEKFGGNFVVMVRYHNHLKKLLNNTENSSSDFIDASMYPDIQELIAASYVAITDYSSWIYDFILTGNPGFIFASDSKNYLKERELYFPIDSTPFPYCSSLEMLISNIQHFNKEEFAEEREKFLNKAGCIESGSAAAKIVDYLLG